MKKVKLSEVCLKITDGSHNPPKGQSSGEYYMLSSRNIQENGITFDSARLLSYEDFEQENKRTDVMPGDVLLTIVGTIGRTFVVPEGIKKFTLQRSVAVLKPDKDKLDSKYLMYTLRTRLKFLEANARGAAQKGIYLNQLKDIDIYLPPLEEQQFIVSKLEDAFIKIDRAIELNDLNIRHANELFENKLDEIMVGYEGWETSTLMDVSMKITDGSHFSPKAVEDGTFPYVTVRDVIDDYIDFENAKRINQTSYEELVKNGCKPEKNDLLFSKDGTVGKVSLVDYDKDFVVLSSLAIIRPNTALIDPSFLKLILKSPRFLKLAIGLKSGAAIRRIILRDLKSIRLRYPKLLEEQKARVYELEKLDEEVRLLKSKLIIKKNYLIALKQSMLRNTISEIAVK